MKKNRILLPVILLLCYTFFCYLMLQITLQYIPFNTDVAFLSIKQDEIALTYYKIAFFIHVYSSILALLAAFTQFSKTILRKFPKVHRIGGWIYVITIVFFAGPSGLIIGYHANGGRSSQLAFCLLAILWIIFTAAAFYQIKKKDIIRHQHFMYRSFALTLSAITLRLWKYILVAIFMPKPMDLYRLVAWLGWVVNFIIAEIIIFKYYQKQPKISLQDKSSTL